MSITLNVTPKRPMFRLDELKPFTFYYASTGELVYMLTATWAMVFKDCRPEPYMTTSLEQRGPYTLAEPGVSVTLTQD